MCVRAAGARRRRARVRARGHPVPLGGCLWSSCLVSLSRARVRARARAPPLQYYPLSAARAIARATHPPTLLARDPKIAVCGSASHRNVLYTLLTRAPSGDAHSHRGALLCRALLCRSGRRRRGAQLGGHVASGATRGDGCLSRLGGVRGGRGRLSGRRLGLGGSVVEHVHLVRVRVG